MDNRTSEQGLAWDAVVVEDLLNEIKQDEGELDAYLEDLQHAVNPEPIDYMAEWEGMPEFNNPAKAYKSIQVHFENEEDYKSFCILIEQELTDKTNSIWYPEKKHRNMKSLEFQNES
jgi:hypothetical protein